MQAVRVLITILGVFFIFLCVLFAELGFCGDMIRYKRTVNDYDVPYVTLVNQDGQQVRLRSLLLDDKKPVFLDFIYATCTTICPILSAGFSHFQKTMGPEAGKVQLVSISIDPDNDRPEVMRDYLTRYKSQPGWEFLTGSRRDIIQVMKAFDAYVIDKMNHFPLMILHSPGSDKWVRIDGLIGISDLMKEYGQIGTVQ